MLLWGRGKEARLTYRDSHGHWLGSPVPHKCQHLDRLRPGGGSPRLVTQVSSGSAMELLLWPVRRR